MVIQGPTQLIKFSNHRSKSFAPKLSALRLDTIQKLRLKLYIIIFHVTMPEQYLLNAGDLHGGGIPNKYLILLNSFPI